MNKPNVRKWVKALRSGKFKQTRSMLYSGNGYCCLGVVCVLSGMESKKDKKGNFYFGNRQIDYLPASAQRWLGIDEKNPLIGPKRAGILNDEDGLNFTEIADEIEKHWLSA